MKLYFYCLKNDAIVKMEVKGIRENKHEYVVPAGKEYPFNSLHDYAIQKTVCNAVQVTDDFYRHGPFIISEKDGLENTPGLKESFTVIAKNCNALKDSIAKENP